MNRFNLILTLILVILIVLHLAWSIDYSVLYTVGNKGGATGAMICILGLISLWLSHREESGERDIRTG
ncbi:MAG: hypothetical protein KGY60_13500 [Bacteroidales bacterium]|nr:hypothetical protein [Bacteroidales bacterium]